tara:strand:- start:254 stop:427 length:174 start_codon:yes stop_codon:yes gene_type:complete
MSRKTVVLENVDMELLSQQKRDLLDIIADHKESSPKIKSLDGLLHMIDYIQDKIEKG